MSAITASDNQVSLICAECKTRPCFFDPVKQTTHVFCGRRCARKATAKNPLCLNCGAAPKCFAPGSKQVILDFCSSACKKAAMAKGPCLLPMSPNDPKFNSVQNQFNASWNRTVQGIFKIIPEPKSYQAYKAYRASFAQRGQKPNEERRFHGTPRACNLGEGGNVTFCNQVTCTLCQLLQTGFKHPNRFTRSYDGLYFAVDSSISDSYIKSTTTPKAMILARIIEGQAGVDSKRPQDKYRVIPRQDGALPAYL
ncbi:hypothetical protein OC835_001730 [Tilletia horrida]|uniref:PARP catalytic domain-containing protein n=1 Tax=Tilletia horrida TaxID=155126 RepID=A0AAN6GIG1_9BASI|nr:hypothetical protein OC835_001730 [Tilletia horrida]KAK0539566.1 hypothetical protein OC842_000916 [Tilletia horrida]